MGPDPAALTSLLSYFLQFIDIRFCASSLKCRDLRFPGDLYEIHRGGTRIMIKFAPRAPMLLWIFATIVSVVLVLATVAQAQYTQTTLVTNTQDPNLVNAWGLAYSSTSPFWVSDERTGKSTVYDASGTIVSLVVTVPPGASGGKTGTPAGIVANSSSGFIISQNGTSGPATFIFSTLDGTISGWNSSVNATNAVIAVNNSATANYPGLAIATNSTGATFLYAANMAKNQIEVYNNAFKLVKTFTDSSLTGMAVYGIQAIKGSLYVTFTGRTGAAVDVFTTSGTKVKTLISNTSSGPLVNPWGVAIAPSNFGVLSGTLLVGNVTSGEINAFNPTTGAFKGVLSDKNKTPIANPGLWGMQFGGGTGGSGNGNTNQLFITAGGGNYSTGVFAVIQ
jgi:uncharacterized protein (TIGR03118 family)